MLIAQLMFPKLDAPLPPSPKKKGKEHQYLHFARLIQIVNEKSTEICNSKSATTNWIIGKQISTNQLNTTDKQPKTNWKQQNVLINPRRAVYPSRGKHIVFVALEVIIWNIHCLCMHQFIHSRKQFLSVKCIWWKEPYIIAMETFIILQIKFW